MPGWNVGPERAAAIRALEAQIEAARDRLQGLDATADAQEASFEARDAADLEYGRVQREFEIMEQTLRTLSDPTAQDDLMTMEDALKILRSNPRE
jgi:hypothetical protein